MTQGRPLLPDLPARCCWPYAFRSPGRKRPCDPGLERVAPGRRQGYNASRASLRLSSPHDGGDQDEPSHGGSRSCGPKHCSSSSGFAQLLRSLLSHCTRAQPSEGREQTPRCLPSGHLAASLIFRDCWNQNSWGSPGVHASFKDEKTRAKKGEHCAKGGSVLCRLIKTTLASILVFIYKQIDIKEVRMAVGAAVLLTCL